MALVFLMRWLALCLATLAVTGCGHDLTRKDSTTLAPVSIAGRQLEYADPHGNPDACLYADTATDLHSGGNGDSRSHARPVDFLSN